MAYAGTLRPPERAAKLGHRSIISNRLVVKQVSRFYPACKIAAESTPPALCWEPLPTEDSTPFKRICVVDGSFSVVRVHNGMVGYVKTAALNIDMAKLGMLDARQPHPWLLRDALDKDAQVITTVIPLDGIVSEGRTAVETFCRSLYDAMNKEYEGKLFATLQWLFHRQWSGSPTHSPSFSCPHCGEMCDGFKPGRIKKCCSSCGHEVLLTDATGLPEVFIKSQSGEVIANAYMHISEALLMMTMIREALEKGQESYGDTLFMLDGPLAFYQGFYRFTDACRALMQHYKEQGIPLYLCGIEKSGAIHSHVARLAKDDNTSDRSFCFLSHDYTEENIRKRASRKQPYGLRPNWGEKLGVKIDGQTCILVNIPVGLYDESEDAPFPCDLMGSDRILSAIPGLVCRLYSHALFPIAAVNDKASISIIPSRKILTQFTADMLNTAIRN